MVAVWSFALLLAVSRVRWFRLPLTLVRVRCWSFVFGLGRVRWFRFIFLFGASRRCWFWSFASCAAVVSFVLNFGPRLVLVVCGGFGLFPFFVRRLVLVDPRNKVTKDQT